MNHQRIRNLASLGAAGVCLVVFLSGSSVVRDENPTYSESRLTQISLPELALQARMDLDQLPWKPLNGDLAVLLGYRAAPDAYSLLRENLLRDYGGRNFSLREEHSMINAVRGIGFLADSEEAAWTFLLGATTPEFWQAHVTWRGESQQSVRWMTGATIKAVAMTGRPEVPEILRGLREGPREFVDEYYAAMVDAAEYYFRRTKFGRAALREHRDYAPEYDPWLLSEEGKDWTGWSRALRAEEKQKLMDGTITPRRLQPTPWEQ